MNILKREQIKDRMIRLAAEHWNLNENEIEANFDPLIILLFDAVAAEMEAVGYEIKDIQNNLLNELSSLMLPHSLLQAKPASCILTAAPNDKDCIIKKENNFSTTTQIQKLGEPIKELELNFTSIGEVKLLKTSISYVRIGNKVYKYQPDGRKILVYDGPGETMIANVQFVLDNKESLNSLEGLQLFFDLRGHSEARNFYFALQNAAFTINGKAINFSKGYYNDIQFQPALKDAFNRDGDYSRKLQKEIAALYADQFITIHEPLINKGSQPNLFLEGLPEKVAQDIFIPENLYCNIQFSRPFNKEMLERLQIGVNAFPAINRKLQTVHFKTDKWINIIPLLITGSYLDIQSIEGLNGNKYRVQGSAYDGKLNEGEAVIRTARVGRSSSGDVRNTIKSLLEAIRDESAYFSRTNNDFIASRLIEISKILTRLEDQMQLSKDIKPDFRYILLRPKNANETVHIHYWITSPEDAAAVKASAQFKPVQHTFTNSNQTYSLTNAIGGVETLNDYSQKQMLKRQLSSRGKIISMEDVKLLCYELFGAKLNSVKVHKTMRVLPDKVSGIARYIEISIAIGKNDFSEDEIAYLEKQLRYQLDTNASFMFPFEITIVAN